MITRDHSGKLAGGSGGEAATGEFDVFLSHNTRDKPVVERIAEQLRRNGLQPFLDVWDLTPGGRWQRELTDGLARSKACALFVGPHSFGQWQLEELELALVWANQRDGFRVFAVLLPGVEDPFDAQRLPPFLSTRTWVDLRGGITSRRALQQLLNAIKGVAQGSATPAEPLGGVAPYRGLASFEEQHAEFFFGRETEVQRLLEILKTSPLLCVIGPSGSGKSSLVRAGLLPRLRAGELAGFEDCRVCLLRPGAHPLQALATQLAPLGGGRSMQATLDGLGADRRSLHLAVSLALGADAPRRRVLIVVDQLEEIFTLCSDEREREQFLANLLHAAFASGGQTVVVLTMRADFYARCTDYPELAQRTARSLMLVGAMDTDGLRQAIEEPARRVGMFFEPGLAQTILDDVGPASSALPLLEHALLELWHRRIGDQLTLDGYVEAGRVEGALAKRAEDVFSNFTRQQQDIARRTMLRLTQPGEGTEDTRRRAARSELAGNGRVSSVDEVLGRLVDARLLTTGHDDTGLDVVDVSHEALIRGWPRLRSWIDADRAGLLTHRRLTDAAREWDAHKREPTALYRGPQLAGVRDWVTEHADDLSDLERDFLKASAVADKRTTRRLKILAIGLAALTVIVATLAVSALDQRNNARRQTAKAWSLGLATSASLVRDRRPDISLLLALEAYRASPLAAARSSTLAALIAIRVPSVLAILHGHTGAVQSVALSSDKRTLASAGDDGTIRLWDVRTHKHLGAPLNGHGGSVSSVAFSPGAPLLASAGDDGTIRFWDGRTHKQLGAPLRHNSGFVSSVTFSPNGRMLACADTDGIRLWDVRTHRPLGESFSAPIDNVNSVAFSPNGRMLASAGGAGTVRLWDVRTHKALGAPWRHQGVVSSVVFSSNGRMLASAGGAGGTVRLWDVRTHKALGAPLRNGQGVVSSVAFSPNGRMLASANGDKTIRLWDVRSQKALRTLSGHTGSVLSVAFSADGRMLASASADSTVRLWDVRTREALGAPLPGHTSGVGSVTFDPNPNILASGSGDGAVRLWSVRTHKALGAPLKGHTGLVRSVAFSPDGRLLASAGDDWTIRLWSVRAHKALGPPLKSHSDVVRSVAFSPDGRLLASAGDDGTIRLWNTRTHKPLAVLLEDRTNAIQSVTFSPDGRLLASGDTHGAVRLWNVRAGNQLGTPLRGHKGFVNSVAFSPDGRMLASGGDDDTIQLWDTRTHELIGPPLIGHTSSIYSVAFNRDGATLASGSGDGTVRLWDVPSHTQLRPALRGHKNLIESVAFSPDGRTLASGGDDTTIRLWEHILWRNVDDLQSQVCRLVGNGLSRAEWARYAAGIPYRQSCT
jgi:WD40 repeat protein